MAKRRSRKDQHPEVLAVLLVIVFACLVVPSSVAALVTAIFLTLLALGFVVWYVLGHLGHRHSVDWYSLTDHFQTSDPVKMATLDEIDAMGGVEFERFIGRIYEAQGYAVEYTSASGDYGVDLVMTKDHIRTAVQVKRYKPEHPLTQAPIREVVAGMMYYQCAGAMVVTSSTFTKSALTLARSNYVKLIDRDALVQLVVQSSVSKPAGEEGQSSSITNRETIGEFAQRIFRLS